MTEGAINQTGIIENIEFYDARFFFCHLCNVKSCKV